MGDDGLLFLVGFLAGVALEGDRRPALRESPTQKLLQFVELAVGQGVHGVDDDGLDASAAAMVENIVHDGDDVGQALPGAGAGGQDIVVAGHGSLDGVSLMLMESQRPVRFIGGFDAEDVAALRVQRPLVDQVLNPWAGLEAGV